MRARAPLWVGLVSPAKLAVWWTPQFVKGYRSCLERSIKPTIWLHCAEWHTRAEVCKALQAGSASSGMDGEGVGVGVERVGGEGEMQAATILLEGNPTRAEQLHAQDWPR